MSIQILSTQESKVYKQLKNAKGTSPVLAYIKDSFKLPTVEKVKAVIADLVSQGRNNPDAMAQLLGFDIYKIMGIKIFTIETINQALSKRGFAWRALNATLCTSLTADWVSFQRLGQVGHLRFTELIDSEFNRYIKFANGQLFRCSSGDLRSLAARDKTAIRSYLTDEIDLF
ncbi:MAG TPA: hypothetical protein VD794_05460 [Flavisolibacter sp.]|nr:hypothetical protein [Flavisolibacter sp.]